MLNQFTADIFQSFIVGSVAVLLGGIIFEGGRRYVKIGGSNEFKGKIIALPFFIATVLLGRILQGIEPTTASIAVSVPTLTRIGAMGFAGMLLLNYSVHNFNYSDRKSMLVYILSAIIALAPFINI